MDLRLRDKKVFITASSGGIGLATAKAFLGEGANVIINGRSTEKLVRVVEELKATYGDNIDCIGGDMTDTCNISKVADYINSKYKSLDVVVANLGSGKPESNNPLSRKEWERFYNINVMGTVELLNELKDCLARGEESSVSLIASVVSKEVESAPVGYAAAKSAVCTLNKYLSHMWADDGIRVNCILPGNIYFEGGRWNELMDDDEIGTRAYIESAVSMKRFGKPEEIADAIVFLSSSRASFITGAELAVDGGQMTAI